MVDLTMRAGLSLSGIDHAAPGQVLFYLYKFCNGTTTCSYGQTSSGAERTPSAGACP